MHPGALRPKDDVGHSKSQVYRVFLSDVGRKGGHVSPAFPKVCSMQTSIIPAPPSVQSSVHVLLEPGIWCADPSLPFLASRTHLIPLWFCLLVAPACQLWHVPGALIELHNPKFYHEF